MKKKHFTLQVTTSMEMAVLIGHIAYKSDAGYITIDKIEAFTPKVNKRGRPVGAGVNIHTKRDLSDPAIRGKAMSTLQARLQKSVEALSEIMLSFPSATMEGYCEQMTKEGATNRYNQPWTPKNLWPYYEKAYAIVEGKIKLSYVEKPAEVSDEFAPS